MLKVCAHARAGYHYFTELLHANLVCGSTVPDDLHYSHSRIPEGEPFVNLYREVQPVMVSLWRVRERSGIAGSVSFSEMLRGTRHLPRPTEARSIELHGVGDSGVCPMKWWELPPEATVLDRWLHIVTLFKQHATLTVDYDDAVYKPLDVVEAVASTFSLERRQPFVVPKDRYSWYSTAKEDPAVTLADLHLLAEYQKRYEDLP